MQPFPQSWNGIIEANVFHDQKLDIAQRARLRQLVTIFIAEKHWEGCRGLTVNDEIKVTIAAQACLLVVGLQDVYFDHVLSILVYPTAYLGANTEISRAGVVIEEGQARMGEAWYRGPVVLSWADALAGGKHRQPGHNLVLHEFAHQLDMMNGRRIDGTPRLQSRAQYARVGPKSWNPSTSGWSTTAGMAIRGSLIVMAPPTSASSLPFSRNRFSNGRCFCGIITRRPTKYSETFISSIPRIGRCRIILANETTNYTAVGCSRRNRGLTPSILEPKVLNRARTAGVPPASSPQSAAGGTPAVRPRHPT